jgi:hypothetical protein
MALNLSAKDILRGVESLAGMVAASGALPQPWGLVMSGVSAAVGLAADLVERGLAPDTTIEAMRSALPAFADADARLAEYLASKAAAGASAPSTPKTP